MSNYDLSQQPAPSSCRIIDFDKAQVVPGIVNNTWILVVRGQKPCINMEVMLLPVYYIKCPEYWRWEVIGCLPGGICLPAIDNYTASHELGSAIGSEGIEVVGANQSVKIEVSGGCCDGTLEVQFAQE